MLLKWIVCRVAQQQRDVFSNAQQAWQALAAEPGFLGQCGGWADDQTACILGLWQSAQAHQRFLLEGSHDAIVSASQQMYCLESWSTALLEQVSTMQGRDLDLATALTHATEHALLRIADCTVPRVQQPAFLQAQSSIWLPAMRDASGMLGGSFSTDGGNRFLVATLWESAEHHQRYRAEDLPSLRAQVQTLSALPPDVVGYAIELRPNWMVRDQSELL